MNLSPREISHFVQNFKLLKSSKILFFGGFWIRERSSVTSNLIEIPPALRLVASLGANLNASSTIVHSRSQEEKIAYLRSFFDKMMKARSG